MLIITAYMSHHNKKHATIETRLKHNFLGMLHLANTRTCKSGGYILLMISEATKFYGL